MKPDMEYIGPLCLHVDPWVSVQSPLVAKSIVNLPDVAECDLSPTARLVFPTLSCLSHEVLHKILLLDLQC